MLCWANEIYDGCLLFSAIQFDAVFRVQFALFLLDFYYLFRVVVSCRTYRPSAEKWCAIGIVNRKIELYEYQYKYEVLVPHNFWIQQQSFVRLAILSNGLLACARRAKKRGNQPLAKNSSGD